MKNIILKLCVNIIYENPDLFPISFMFKTSFIKDNPGQIKLYLENYMGLKQVINGYSNSFEDIFNISRDISNQTHLKQQFIRVILLNYFLKFPEPEELNMFDEIINNIK